MKFSIITINYNNFQGLQDTFQSVSMQDFQEYEYIIIDGGSGEETRTYIEQHSNELAYWVSEPDGGVYDAMNKGIARATGDYIMFLNSGDYLLNETVLAGAAQRMQAAGADIYYGNIELEKTDGQKYIKRFLPVLTLDFWEEKTINHQASFFKRSLFNELGLYDTTAGLAADYAFYLKAFVYGKKYHYLDQDLVHYKLDGLSTVQMERYLLLMKTIWNSTMPGYVLELRAENKALKLELKGRLMVMVKKLRIQYEAVKGLIKR